LSGGPADAQLLLVSASGLLPNTVHEMEATFAGGSRRTSRSRTLPSALPPDEPFTVAVGSCYSFWEDRGRLSSFYPGPFRASGPNPIRLRLLVGDQLYMDLDPVDGDLISLRTPDAAARYATQWRADDYGAFVEAGATLWMADDHEYWNNYPARTGVQIPWSAFADKKPFDDAFAGFQAALNLSHADLEQAAAQGTLAAALEDAARTFEIRDTPVPLFVLDTRTNRAGSHFTRPEWLSRACSWIAGLETPGILVLSQPLIERARFFLAGLFIDKNLPDHQEDFASLWNAVARAPHDLIIVSGDIHWSRLYLVQNPADPTRKVFELVSSSLSRIHFEQGTSAVANTQGVVKWDGGGTVSYTRVGGLAFNAAATFATFTLFNRSASGGATAYDVVFGFHFPPEPAGGAAKQFSSEVFTLR
jgi:hypothetical protein